MLSPTKRSPKTTYLPLCPWSWSNSRWRIVIWQMPLISDLDNNDWSTRVKRCRAPQLTYPKPYISTSRSSTLLLVISWCFLNKHPSASLTRHLMNILVHIVYCQQRSVRYNMSINRYIMTTAERVQAKMWLTIAELKSSFSDLSLDGGAEKKPFWLSLKRPLQQLNRTRNTYNFIFYCFLYGFVLLFLVFLGPYDHLHETLSTSQIRILVKRSTKVINSAFHIKEYFILRVSISFLFTILRNLIQKVKCVFFGVL